MSQFRPLANIAQTIKTHLQLGGEIDDEVGLTLSEKYADACFSIPVLRNMFSEFEVTKYDVVTILVAGVNALMPNPCVKISFMDALAASLIFQEPEKHLREMLILSDYRGDPPPEGKTLSQHRRSGMAHWTDQRMLDIKLAHDLAYGPSKFAVIAKGGLASTELPKGCFGLILFIGACGCVLTSFFM